jgi:hypothetical protein
MRPGTRWLLAAGAVVVAGIALRVALYVPASAFPIDSDGVLAALCALKVRAGDHPAFFPGGFRLGAASCYLTAGFFAIAGTSRAALAMTGLTWGVLYLVASAALTRTALGARAGCVALVFAALPSAAFLTVTYVPWGYGEIAASCAATLWLAVLWRARASPWTAGAFGLSAGIGVWMSLQTLMVALPALVWIFAYRRPKATRELLPAAIAACAGAFPWLAANVLGGFPSFARNWVAVPVSGGAALWSNAVWFFTSPLPQLFAYGGAVATWLPLCAGVAIALGAFVASLKADEAPAASALRPRELAWLLGAVTAAVFILDVASTAGSVRGWTVRYLTPLYVVAPLALGAGIDWLWRRKRRAVAIAVGALLLLPNLALYDVPGTPGRVVLRNQLSDDARLHNFLAAHRIGLIYGDYFDVYHLNFDALGVAVAVPAIPALDYLHYGDALGRMPVAWAALVPEGAPLPAGVVRLGAPGRDYAVGGMRVFVATRPAGNAAKLLAALRRS